MNIDEMDIRLNCKLVCLQNNMEMQIDTLAESSFNLGYHKSIQYHSDRVGFITRYFYWVMKQFPIGQYILVNPKFYYDCGCSDIKLFTLIASNSITVGQFLVCL